MKARSLSGKVAIVTGGSRGIGKALTNAFAEEGVVVAIGDVDISEPTRAAFAAPLDVSDAADFGKFFDEVEKRLGPVDILVNNAGIMPTGLVDQMNPAVNARIVQVNLLGVMNGIGEATRRMKPRGHGHIVNVASLTARLPGAGVAAYCASKAAVLAYSQAADIELDGTGVNLSIILPSLVKTDLVAGIEVKRGTPTCTPDDVAARVVDVLRRPRFEAYVPRSVAPVAFIHQSLPRCARKFVARITNADRMIQEMDADARVGYDARLQQVVDKAPKSGRSV
ncbi:SDR family NAD(P)-dependent oxidoreductase [Mycobacterium kyogaense]|uniref:SDR family NAD(P)-dependent oxidoreductase n=1 Tax=Mycobacterium kyogaense TaxID=2212479 RepID=UPI0013C50964|nr:SDR family NAD(P)-dependent oxidoreductase [Mycobacterium kyogaense]